MRWAQLDTPIGELSYAVDDVGVCAVHFGPRPGAGPADDEVGDQLRAYFAGELTAFSVPLHVLRGSEFERAVWEQMKLIPFGETRSYGAVASAVGEPGGAQAVGTACNRNPLPLIVPCHRIIGADGKLVGFGGGLERKRILLELEAKVRMELEWRDFSS
ncbi:methylated-DNA--[protein]-cysteine S-methyltransferase [Allorhizocola rhizosphaerae]|uniref:methylated-DNA--[protein]-cysteine S-methyltransferase n=1 Tax=Allorhizocola rhizosphaerae TaxID=1872709 RepID=UPI000E3C8341|nr:methylated-DNA--[protein]-cysteine S-methyltransferase [Allorhizocola rhizosphaerae]